VVKEIYLSSSTGQGWGVCEKNKAGNKKGLHVLLGSQLADAEGTSASASASTRVRATVRNASPFCFAMSRSEFLFNLHESIEKLSGPKKKRNMKEWYSVFENK